MRIPIIPSIIITVAALISFIFAGDTTFGIGRNLIQQNQKNVTENDPVVNLNDMTPFIKSILPALPQPPLCPMKRPPEVLDMARISNAVYDFENENFKAPPGYRLVEKKLGDNGFQAAAFQNDAGQIVIAYRGTEFSKFDGDKTADFQIVRGNGGDIIDSQIKQSIEFTDSVTAKYGSDNIQALTGHSLGGYIAQINGARTEITTHTFNAPGVDESAIEKYVDPIDPINKSLPIVNHVRDSDPVGNFGNHIGEVKSYPDHGDPDGLIALEEIPGKIGDNHKIVSFIEDIENRKDFKGVITTDEKLNEERARKAGGETHADSQDKENDGSIAKGEGQAKQEEAENKAFEGKILEKVKKENAKDIAQDVDKKKATKGEAETEETKEDMEPSVGLKDENITKSDKTNEFTDKEKTEPQNNTEMNTNGQDTPSNTMTENEVDEERADNKTNEVLKREDAIENALGMIRETNLKNEREHGEDSKNLLENATKETESELQNEKDTVSSSQNASDEIDDEFQNDLDNVASNQNSSDEFNDTFEKETSTIVSLREEDAEREAVAEREAEARREYQDTQDMQARRYQEEQERAYQNQLNAEAKKARKREEDGSLARSLGALLTNTASGVLGGVAAQQQARDAARIAENIRRQEEYRRMQEEARRKAAEHQKYLKDMQDRRYQEAYQKVINDAAEIEAYTREARRREEEEARLLAERKRREEEDARLLAERNRQNASNSTGSNNSIDVTGFNSHEPWNPRPSNIPSGQLDDYSNVDYGTQEDRDYWADHPDAAAERREEDSYSGGGSYSGGQGVEIPP